MTNSPSTSPDTDPVAADSTVPSLLHAACELAVLLTEAKPLVEILNSTTTPHAYRGTLRYLMGVDEYFVLVNGLQAMTSQPAWAAAHAHEVIPPELLRRLEALGIDVTQP